jgi:hypothetical protein
MAAVYSESKKHPGHWSVRVGAHSPAKAFNIQHFTRGEAMTMKAVAPPMGNSILEFQDLRTGASPIMELLINLNPLKTRVLPHNHPDSLDDYEVLEALRNSDDTKIKAALYNRRSDTFWFLTGTSVQPDEKHMRAVEPGWYVYTSHLTAPPAFWSKVRERI